jgi:hypothetical protein
MTDIDSEFLGAIRREDLIKIERLAREGADISSPIPEANYMTPLHIAIYNHNIDMTRLLLKLGADPWVENPVSGATYISQWENGYHEYEKWDKLEEFFFLYCEYEGHKHPSWCHVITSLIFSEGWPRATDYFKQEF